MQRRKKSAAQPKGSAEGEQAPKKTEGNGESRPVAKPRPPRVIDVRVLEAEKKKIEFSLIISLVSLLLSAVAALAALYAYIQDSNVEVRPPQTLYLYRDGRADSGILKAALNVTMINTADTKYGDALIDARIQLGNSPSEWGEEATANISISSEVPAAAPSCAVGRRCVANGAFLSEEEDYKPISLGGGKIETVTLVFPVTISHCRGDAETCADTGLFEAEVTKQVSNSMTVTLTLDFLRDSTKVVTCKVVDADIKYLISRGFMSRTCRTEEENE